MLDAAIIERAANTGRVSFAVTCHDEVGSTNEEVKRLIGLGAPEGAVVTSIVQTGGYGRQGRRWASPAGSLYGSFLLRPLDHGVAACELPTLSLAVALAVRDALVPYAGDREVFVKWPNDLLCDQGKLCGISLEAIGGAVCIGVGINVFAPAEPPATTGAFQPAYLERIGDLCLHGDVYAGERPDVLGDAHDGAACIGERLSDDPEKCRTQVLETLAGQFLVALDRRYARWLDEGFGAFVGEYNDHAFLNGRKVGISSLNGTIVASGLVERVDARGSLVLLDEYGNEQLVASGEAHVVL